MTLTDRPWLIAVLLGMLALSPAQAGMTPEEVKSFAGYKAKAEKGDLKAHGDVARCYQEGIGVAKDRDEAVKWLHKAAHKGDGEAQNWLGNYHLFGFFTPDYAQAVKWFRKSAEQGHADSQYWLGRCYEDGGGVAKDEIEAYAYVNLAGITYEKARKHLAILEKKLSPEARLRGQQRAKELQKEIEAKIAAKKTEKSPEAVDEVKAFEGYKAKAEKGDMKAQYNLGNSYYNGDGTAPDYAQAVKWFRKSAEQGHADSQYWLGRCYEDGDGVAKDEIEAYAYVNLAGITYEEARKYLAILEKKLSPEARLRGQQRAKELQKEIEAKISAKKAEKFPEEDEETDEVKAFEGYKAKAEKGDPIAQYKLGKSHYYGSGVAQDYVQSVKWYRKAAEQGEASAQYELGMCYYARLGVAQDLVEAVKWYRKAADQGHVQAQTSLGSGYYYGSGVAQDDIQAVKWYRKASDQGHAYAQFYLGRCC